MPFFNWYSKPFQHHQGCKIASVQNKILQLTKPKKSDKDKMPPKASGSPSLSSLSRPLLTSHFISLLWPFMDRLHFCCHLTSSHLHCLHLHYTINFGILIIWPNLSLSQNLPALPFPMKYVPFKEASEDSEAKSLISYIPLTKVELWTDKKFSKVIETSHILADKFNIVI